MALLARFQTQTTGAAAMDMMMKPTEQHRKLEKLAGTWVGEEKMYPGPWDPKGGKAKSRQTARVDLDGFFVITDYQQERDGKTSYRGHGVYGYDANRKQTAGTGRKDFVPRAWGIRLRRQPQAVRDVLV